METEKLLQGKAHYQQDKRAAHGMGKYFKGHPEKSHFCCLTSIIAEKIKTMMKIILKSVILRNYLHV